MPWRAFCGQSSGCKADGETGTVTVENVLWLPVFLTIIGFGVDATLSVLTMTRMWDVARDGARRAATGQMSAEAAERYMTGRLPDDGRFSISVEDREVDVIVRINASEIGTDLFFDILRPANVGATYRMLKER